MYELLLVSWLTAGEEARPPPQRADRIAADNSG
jgi:hypothetical protein